MFFRCRKKCEVCCIDWPGDVGLGLNGCELRFVNCCCPTIGFLFSAGFILNYFPSFWKRHLLFTFNRLNLLKNPFRAGSTVCRMITRTVDTFYGMITRSISMVIHGAFWAFGGIFASVFVMSKLLATETSQRVGDEWGNVNFQKASIDFGRNCTPMESEDDGCSCNFVSIFCDYNFLCLTNTLLFKIVNYIFHGSKLQFAAPDDTLDGIQCPTGGYFNWNID